MIIEGLSYPDAVKTIKLLDDIGVKAVLSVGCLRLHIDKDKLTLVKKIVDDAEGILSNVPRGELAQRIMTNH